MNLNNIIYTIIAVLILGVLFRFALWLLPYALIAFAIYWLYNKLFAHRGRKNNNSQDNVYKGNANPSYNNNEDIRADSSKKVIDVDYEEVDD